MRIRFQKALTLLAVVVVQVLSQDDKSQQPAPAYDPQLLNYQLALQQYSGLQGQEQPYETQSALFTSAQQQQQQGVTGSGEAQQYSTLQALNQYLQQRQYQVSQPFSSGQIASSNWPFRRRR